ncbi:hypothetical protein [Salinarimonas ramus]|uniref:Uncharacterized protein n=1 Tax=Salinarimonas ramus TaxID=690164 RepID=A0A917V416_9HYPH|nr:hypothetical protein [Salinarimonas ramus]GGK36637.1 hypothetical protein GCM10011322_24530 [Salinarimonas ramus]
MDPAGEGDADGAAAVKRLKERRRNHSTLRCSSCRDAIILDREVIRLHNVGRSKEANSGSDAPLRRHIVDDTDRPQTERPVRDDCSDDLTDAEMKAVATLAAEAIEAEEEWEIVDGPAW